MRRNDTANVSLTAHYTGAVWVRNGLSNPALETPAGRLMYNALRPMNSATALLRRPTLEHLLLARHTTLDHLLTQAIDQDGISQVVEIAAGLSPRGWRLSRRYKGKLVYVETDLPAMAARKRKLLAQLGALPRRHRVEQLDALAESGENSLQAILSRLDHRKSVCIITEGLLNYFDAPAVKRLWQGIARGLKSFSSGLYLSDLHVASEQPRSVNIGFRVILSTAIRDNIHFHFRQAEDAEAGLLEAGFSQARLNRCDELLPPSSQTYAKSAKLLRIVSAKT